jgi:DNA-binding NarL/FixJ family response regulator
LLADDDALVRAELRLVLKDAADIEVVAEASDGAEAVNLAIQHRADVVLMDVRMPGMDGLAAMERLVTRSPDVQVVIMTVFREEEYVIRALTAGAAGFVLKDSEPHALLHAVRAAAAGYAMLSPQITRWLIDQYVITHARRSASAGRLVNTLTDREREVLAMVGLGLSNREVGKALHLGEGTVKTHVCHILKKLGCSNRVEAALLARDADLFPRRPEPPPDAALTGRGTPASVARRDRA